MIALSGALMPGPLLTATISESARRGMITGPLLVFGHGILELALLLALLVGLAPFLRQDSVFAVIAIAGAGILIWIAVGMFRARPSLNIAGDTGKAEPGDLIMSGLLMSLANPYWIIWWATIGLGYVLYCRQYGPWGITFFFAGHISADLAWYTAVAMAVAKGRHFLNDRLYRWLIWICASVLLLFACYFFYTGLHKAGLL
jgi:threonine/homoserine/homoserine lactone efflux protein